MRDWSTTGFQVRRRAANRSNGMSTERLPLNLKSKLDRAIGIFLSAIRLAICFARRARGGKQKAGLSGDTLLGSSPRFVKVAVAAILLIGLTFTILATINSLREVRYVARIGEPTISGSISITSITSSTPKFEAWINHSMLLIICLGGTMLSLLSAGIIWSLGRSRTRALQTVSSMSSELAAARHVAEAAMRESEALRYTLDTNSIVSVACPKGKIIEVNDAFCRISGYSREELIGQTHRIINSGTHPKAFWVEIWKTISRGVTWHGEVCNRAKDGSLYWVDSIIAPFKGSDGNIEKYVSIRTDVTERKRAEQRSTDAAQFLRNAMDSLNSHTVVLGSDARVISYNRAWSEFALANGGGESDVLQGADYLAACQNAMGSCPEAGLVAAGVQSVLAGDVELAPIEYPCHSPAEQRWFLCSIRGFECVGDRFAVVSHLNITAVKEAETRLLSSNSELNRARFVAETASRAKSEFLANMSHEIRTPLTAILGFVDLLKEDGNTALAPLQRVQTIDTIQNAGTHLLSVINDILDLSKIEADMMTIESIDTPLLTILREVESLMRPRAAGKGVAIKTLLRSPVPEHIISDPTRLRQILMNLVGNAAKFTEAGCITIEVGTENRDENASLVVDIEDTGPGMTPDQAQRLFAAFGQADSTITRKHGGTGLGLTICRRLAGKMRGDVTLLHTELGKGSCFRLVLPLEVVAGSVIVTQLDAIQEPCEAKPTTATTKLSGRILLAEDGLDNQQLIAFHLKKAGAEVTIADNGRIALGMLDQATAEGTPYDMLLTDMQMPEMDGYTLARTLRARGSTLPIVALTAHAMAEDRDKCISAGCDDYASKPIDKAKLLETCAAAMSKRVVVMAPSIKMYQGLNSECILNGPVYS